MKTLTAQAKELVNELATREDVRLKLTELQARYQACLKDKATLEGAFRSSTEQLRQEADSLRSANAQLQGEVKRLTQQVAKASSPQSSDQAVAQLREQNERLEKFRAQLSGDLESQNKRAHDLNGSLVAAE